MVGAYSEYFVFYIKFEVYAEHIQVRGGLFADVVVAFHNTL